MNSKKLFEILPSDARIKVIGDQQQRVVGLTQDSRYVNEGDAFIAIKGLQVDGHDYIEKAIEQGAKVIFCSEMPEHVQSQISYVVWVDAQKSLADLATKFYDDPSRSVKLVGVTGTNGKSTIVVLLYQLFAEMGYKAGLISTIKYCFGSHEEVASHTTPDVLKLNQLLSQMRDAGCEYVFMEVSSHGIAQGRIDGLDFDIAVFTNLSQDHLDYHKTYKEYVYTKKKFFDILPAKAAALINIDDKQASVMVQNSKAKQMSYALRTLADYKARILSNQIEGLHLKINDREVFTRLRGVYNAYNLLAVYGVADIFELDTDQILQAISNISGAEGRFEVIYNPKTRKSGIVDYAHTPDAVENLLKNVIEMKSPQSKLITILGCGGDRDKGKRPIMAKIAANYSDIFIMTSDNPRTENPEAILDDMQVGLDGSEEVLRISDRRQAIKTAVMLSKDGDIIVVAGKGHEKYQDVNGKKLPFDDKEIITSTML